MSRVPRKFLLSFWVKAGRNQPVHSTGWRSEEQEFILKNAVVRIWLKGNTFISHGAHATHTQFFQGGLIAWLSFPVGRHLFMFSCTSDHWRLLISVAPHFEPPKSAPLLHFLILYSSTRKKNVWQNSLSFLSSTLPRVRWLDDSKNEVVPVLDHAHCLTNACIVVAQWLLMLSGIPTATNTTGRRHWPTH